MSADLARELVNAVLAAVEHVDDGNAPNRVVEAALAAAEERGRRSGVEEMQALLRECKAAVAEAVEDGSWGFRPLLARIDAALAPRDSGKEG